RGVLTPAEFKVAAHVATGLKQREIAAKLFLSPHTVDAHLRHIYAKLSINNRAALATWYANQDSIT
ncbi:response regulator transcription factor, partial [Catenuloplanes japonicus]|uniref:response regulator transcription factor n=1 Tax=Catenuloplanes japonicus TaxID=33876 RepID=UPI0018DD4CFF